MRTRLLYEMFLPEARFPDEKFWDKEGNPIHPKPKGPPPGTSGKTHADVGARDQDDDPEELDRFNAWDDDNLHPDTGDEENIGHHHAEQMFPGSTKSMKHQFGVDPDECSFDVIDGKLIGRIWIDGHPFEGSYEWDTRGNVWI